jgi:hypothetical protein
MIIEKPYLFIVLDALDECDDREELLQILTSVSEWKAHNTHICITSRKERDIEESLLQIIDRDYIIDAQSDLVDPDIRLYIVERLSRDNSMGKWRQGSQDKEIETVLMNKANGMYVV